MSPESVLTLGHQALAVGLMLAAPLLGVALVVGLVVSIFQAATQINEATLSFIPKVLAVAAAGVVAGPWMLALMLDYLRGVFASLPQLAG